VSSYPTRLITGQPKRGVGDIDWLSASPKWLIFARPRSSDRTTFTNYSGVIYQAIESAEPFYGEFQQRFGVGRTCGVRSVKRDVRAQFYFESFPFSLERPLKTTLAPSSTKRLTIPSPIPLEPPVTTATWFLV
jgi:hypothetical protein